MLGPVRKLRNAKRWEQGNKVVNFSGRVILGLCACHKSGKGKVAENKLYSQDFGVKSWIFFIIGISILYVKVKLYTKFDAKMLIRSKFMID